MYGSTVDTCFVLIGVSEQSRGEAGCFKCIGAGQVEVYLDEEARVL